MDDLSQRIDPLPPPQVGDVPGKSVQRQRRVRAYARHRPRRLRQESGQAFRADTHDPVAHFVRDVVGWDWPQLLAFTFFIYGPLEKLIIPALRGYLHLAGPVTSWVPDLDALLSGFVEFPFFFAFYLWNGRYISHTFVSLAHNRSFDDEARYAAFIRRAQAMFDHRWWPAISATLAIVVVLLVHFVLWGPHTAVPPWFGSNNVFQRLLALVLIGCVAYVVSQIVIRELLTVILLRVLWRTMGDRLVIHPYHPDDAGGLGALGQHAANFAYFLLVVMFFIVVGSLLPTLRGVPQTSLNPWNPLLILLWGLYLTLVPLSFWFLIWPAHQAMCHARDVRLRAISRKLDERLTAMKAAWASDQADVSDIMKQIDSLKAVRTLLQEDFPAWPVNTQIRRQIRISTIIPIAHSLLTLAVTAVRNYLKL